MSIFIHDTHTHTHLRGQTAAYLFNAYIIYIVCIYIVFRGWRVLIAERVNHGDFFSIFFSRDICENLYLYMHTTRKVVFIPRWKDFGANNRITMYSVLRKEKEMRFVCSKACNIIMHEYCRGYSLTYIERKKEIGWELWSAKPQGAIIRFVDF